MKVFFLDTSALLKRYLKESGTEAVDALFEEEGERYVSSLGLLEIFSILQRLHAVVRLLSTEDYVRLRAAVLSDIDTGRVTVANAAPADIQAAAQVLSRRYLTAVDALQIALAGGLGPSGIFVSSDAKLNRSATEEGLQVLDPTRPAQETA